MRLAERLKMVREMTGLDQKEISAQLGISFRSWQDYERGESVPGGKVFEGLVKLGFNANWLLAEQGAMKTTAPAKPLYKQLLDGEVKVGEEPRAAYHLPGNHDVDEEFVRIPRYQVEASAGGGAIVQSEQVVDHLAFRADWVRNALGIPVQSLALINVIGDSMETTLSNGDLILVDISVHGVDDNAVYVLRLDGKLLVKRVQRMLDGSVVVKSDNTVYAPETIRGDLVNSLNVVGRVVWCGRRM